MRSGSRSVARETAALLPQYRKGGGFPVQSVDCSAHTAGTPTHKYPDSWTTPVATRDPHRLLGTDVSRETAVRRFLRGALAMTIGVLGCRFETVSRETLMIWVPGCTYRAGAEDVW